MKRVRQVLSFEELGDRELMKQDPVSWWMGLAIAVIVAVIEYIKDT